MKTDKQKNFTYTVYTRGHGTHTRGAPEIFRDSSTGYDILQFPEVAWFNMSDVVCFFRRENKEKN
jgi:hypothetical protein